MLTQYKKEITFICDYCNTTTVTDIGNLVCKNPECQAPAKPADELLVSLFGRAVEVVTAPIDWLTESEVLPLDQMAAHIIDISKYQYKLVNGKWFAPDFEKMFANTDCIYVIHKSSQGTFSDPCYELGLQCLRAVGAAYGTYHYADPYYSPEDSAEYYAAQINAVPVAERWGTDLLPQHWVDIETRRGSGTIDLSPAELTEWVERFIARLELLIDQPFGIYTRTYFWDSYILLNDWAHTFALWVARYNPLIQEPGEPNDWKRYGKKPVLWQRDADGNGLGEEYGVHSNSIDRNRSPLLTREQVYQAINQQPPEPPPQLVGDWLHTLFPNQAFRTEPSTQGGDTTIIKRLTVGSVLQVVPCDTMDNKTLSLNYSANITENEIWVHCADTVGDTGWLAIYHAQSRRTLYLEGLVN
jgi:GH25 family lysozyme M1 (1,4-beta-N-acetylmuramidase)